MGRGIFRGAGGVENLKFSFIWPIGDVFALCFHKKEFKQYSMLEIPPCMICCAVGTYMYDLMDP